MPYRDAHGCVTDNSGLLFLEPEALKRAVVALDAQGFDAHFHALGDHAVTVALDAIEAAYVDHGRRPGARHTLAHLQVVSSSDVARFRDLGAVANLQMLWACVDEALDELTFPFIDESLVGRHYRFAELADEGVALAAGSDWPVSSAAPFEAVAVAMARAERGSRPDPRIDPAQTIPAEVALAAYTRGSAQLLPGYQGGAVEVGRPADLIVVPEDPTVLPADEVAGLEVEQTWVGGRPVFRRS